MFEKIPISLELPDKDGIYIVYTKSKLTFKVTSVEATYNCKNNKWNINTQYREITHWLKCINENIWTEFILNYVTSNKQLMLQDKYNVNEVLIEHGIINNAHDCDIKLKLNRTSKKFNYYTIFYRLK